MRALAGGGLPGIALSGYGMEEDVRQSLEAGFRKHLTKPVNLQRLEAAIRDVREAH
jgi:CheY-like chemotaxis protein